MIQPDRQSEVARVLGQIQEEYEAGVRGLSGLAQGTSRHSFITARMENMARLQQELEKLVGGEAIGMIATRLDTLPGNVGAIAP